MRDRVARSIARSRRHRARGSTSCPRRRGDPCVAGSPASSTKDLDRRPLGHRARRRCRSPASCACPAAGGDRGKRFARAPDRCRRRRSSPRPFSLPPAGTPAPAPPARRRCGRMRLGCHGRQLAELLGKCARVAGELESLDGEDGGRGVMAVSGAGLRREARHDHVRAERADHARRCRPGRPAGPRSAASPGSPSKTRSLSRG